MGKTAARSSEYCYPGFDAVPKGRVIVIVAIYYPVLDCEVPCPWVFEEPWLIQ